MGLNVGGVNINVGINLAGMPGAVGVNVTIPPIALPALPLNPLGGGDANMTTPIAAGGVGGAVDFNAIALPPVAQTQQQAGNAFMAAGRAQMGAQSYSAAATDFEQAAKAFEAEAQSLLATPAVPAAPAAPAAPADPAGGGAPITPTAGGTAMTSELQNAEQTLQNGMANVRSQIGSLVQQINSTQDPVQRQQMQEQLIGLQKDLMKLGHLEHKLEKAGQVAANLGGNPQAQALVDQLAGIAATAAISRDPAALTQANQNAATALAGLQALTPTAAAPAAGGANPTGGGAPLPPAAPAAPTAGGASTSSPWTVKTDTLDPAKGSWSSTGDPHEVSGDGLKFDNEKTGKFDLIQSASGDFRVQTDQGPDVSNRWPGATLNHAVAIKDGNDTVAYDGVAKTLTLDGKAITPLPTEGQTIQMSGGGTITGTANGGLTITSSQGDITNIKQQDGYIDLSGQLGPNRKDGEVRGALGEFHDENDTDRDLKGRTGDDIIGKPGDAGAISNFEDAWKANDDLFAQAAAPAAGGGDPAGGGAPVAAPAAPAAPAAAGQDQLKQAIRALGMAAEAHMRAGRNLERAGDPAGAAKEFEAAASDYSQVAALRAQWAAGAAANPAGGGLPPANPATPAQHQQRIHKHHHHGFFHKLAHFAGEIAGASLKVAGAIFNPIQAPIMVMQAVGQLAK